MQPDLTPMLVWLAEASLRNLPVETVMAEFCERLNVFDVQIARAHLSTPALHTMVAAYSVEWRPELGERRTDREHGNTGIVSPSWQASPFTVLLNENLRELRHRLDQPDSNFRFPVFEEFAAEGMTDWFACKEGFEWFSDIVPGGQFGILLSFTTRRPGGFPDEHQALLRMLTKPLAVAVKTAFVSTIAHDVLGAYLGGDAARRVLSGAITRGAVTQIPAVLMMADIRGFTRIANSRPIADVVATLNGIFDIVGRAVGEHGGQILKFMGDGALAVFLLQDRNRAEVAGEALAAAAAIQAALPEGAAVDIALHVGDVHYGNIGATGRLDFTVIGPAVNEAARMESLCDDLGRSVLVSQAVADAAPDWAHRLTPLGPHALRGFDLPRQLFALKLD
jgi:adenylate cyclase